MFRWLLLAAVLAVSLAETEPEAAESYRAPIHEHKHEHSHEPEADTNVPGTGVYREIHASGHPLPKKRIEEQNRIVYDLYSPTYTQPTWFLDYRYLKSGGREYVRGDGGQILILPKGVHAKDHGYEEYGDYDELLEFLRLRELAEKEQRAKERKQGSHHHDEGKRNERFYPADEEDYRNLKVPAGWEREAANERKWEGAHRWSKH